MDCGSLPREIEEARSGTHKYSEWRIFGNLSLVSILKDKCCPKCNRRLAFLEFVARARELHSQDKGLL